MCTFWNLICLTNKSICVVSDYVSLQHGPTINVSWQNTNKNIHKNQLSSEMNILLPCAKIKWFEINYTTKYDHQLTDQLCVASEFVSLDLIQKRHTDKWRYLHI